MINKKRIIFLVMLVVIILLLQVLMYKTGIWYDQTVGRFFIYVSIIALAIFLLSPLKEIKDKRKNVSVINYVSGMGAILTKLARAVFILCKEIIVTISYVIAPKLFNDIEKETPENK